MTTPNRILIVGIWGVGKSTLANRIGHEIRWPVVDSDLVIPGFVEAVLAGDAAFLAERAAKVRSLVLDDSDRKMVMSTNLRPLLGASGGLGSQVVDGVVSGQIMIIEVERAVSEIASFLAAHPEEREKRPNLKGESIGEMVVELQAQQSQLAPIYARWRAAKLEVSGPLYSAAIRGVLALLRERSVM